MSAALNTLRQLWSRGPRGVDRNTMVYVVLAIAVLVFPIWAQWSTGGNGTFLISQGADAGVYVLMTIGLNVVVGFAGLLDLGYAAFFAIGAYTYALLASNQLATSPIHMAIHLPFWLLLFIAMFVAAGFGAILGAPTLRLRGDYLAIVTLGFGEIVPRVFRNLGDWTHGVNGVSALDSPNVPIWFTGPWSAVGWPFSPAGTPPADFGIVENVDILDPRAYYLIMAVLLLAAIIAVNNLYRSRIGRAWMAVREDEVAASAMGVNTTRIKLLAFAIGASFSGFAGAFYGAKLSLVSPDAFGFIVSITVLVMIVLGGMGNVPGVIVGSLIIYYISFNILPNLPQNATQFADSMGFGWLNASTPDWPGLGEEVHRLQFLFFGAILVGIMLLRPQGLIPSRVREQELQHAASTEEGVAEVRGEA